MLRKFPEECKCPAISCSISYGWNLSARKDGRYNRKDVLSFTRNMSWKTRKYVELKHFVKSTGKNGHEYGAALL